MDSSDRHQLIADAFALLADSLRPGRDVIDSMADLLEATVRLTAATAAGIMLMDRQSVLHVIASTSQHVRELHHAELRWNEGPSLDCQWSNTPVDVPDVKQTPARWPRYQAAAADRGYQAVHASPMRVRDQTVGAICLFAGHAESLTKDDATLASALTQIATISLIRHLNLHDESTSDDHIVYAVSSRIIIDRATIVVAHQHGASIDAAFGLLRTYAHHNDVNLRTAANQILKRGRLD